MGKGLGFGKVILFGEHFAVYGVSVLISAISSTTSATVRKIKEKAILINDKRKGTPGYIEEKKQMQLDSLDRMFKKIRISPSGIEIVLEGDLPAFSGIGASAASSVAIARAVSTEFGLGLTDDEINAAAYEAEKAYHGEKTAGVDNIAATYGGLIYFTNINPVQFERIRIKNPIEIVIANTGIVADTKEMIEGVAERREQSPEKYNRVIKSAKDVIEKAKSALLNLDLDEVGFLMKENHRLLQAICVSCPELDYLVELASKKGALGAKQTGGGGGGCIVALTPGRELQKTVANAIESEGFSVLKVKVGG